MSALHRRQGQRMWQPLTALAALMGGWIAVQMVAENVSLAGGQTLPPVQIAGTETQPPAASVAQRAGLAPARTSGPISGKSGWTAHWQPSVPQPSVSQPSVPMSAQPVTGPDSRGLLQPGLPVLLAPQPLTTLQPEPLPAPQTQDPPRMNATLAGGHQLPLPPGFTDSQSASAPQARPSTIAARRWSADGWLLLRQGGGPAGLAAIGGSYGASQAGAVLRYRLAPADLHRPTAYLRATAALGRVREQEATFGLSARPIAGLPLVAMAELRASRSATGTRARPAAALVTELAPFTLPLRLRAELYAQGGYVGGRDATAFADGQIRIERKLFSLGRADVHAGAGAWGGAQKGANRVDLGPTASASFPLGGTASARLSADWRFRVAGHAAPASGPALTLSAGF